MVFSPLNRIILISISSSRFLEHFRRLLGYNSLRISWVARLQERQEKGIGQRGHQEQLLTLLPVPQARTLESQFAFVVAPGLLNLPATDVGKDHLPGLFLAGHRFVGEQIPRQASGTATDH